jgi:hypothetical protein
LTKLVMELGNSPLRWLLSKDPVFLHPAVPVRNERFRGLFSSSPGT